MHRYSQSLARHAACVHCALLTYLIHYELKMDLIKVAEEAFATGKQHPEFGPGDTITVAYRIKEGNKERIQMYRGVVIRISGVNHSYEIRQSAPCQTLLPAQPYR